jgi:pimeloyl-ACP methyl ester carboxylesterase
MTLQSFNGESTSNQPPVTGGSRWARRSWRGFGLTVLMLLTGALLWTLWAENHPREERRLRTLVHDQLAAWFPHEMAPEDGWHGLHQRVTGSGERSIRVLLIHGLDEPGTIWKDLLPILGSAGYDVWELHYPNDQGIDRSADYLAAQWAELPPGPPVVLIGHSMGGLVARDFVSRVRHPVGQTALIEGPAIGGVIQVGSPNQGSEWARPRVWLELRDQFSSGEGRRFSLFSALRDGAGEAKIDLRPGSDFLRELNARPWPDQVSILAIAGQLLTPPEGLTVGLDAAAAEVDSPVLRAKLIAWWTGLGDGLGDGVVPLDSARLPVGPPPIVFNATHRGLLARFLPSDPEPPAIAAIVETLERWSGR